MKAQYEEVSYAEFRKFLDTYPRPLTGDKCGISEPSFVSYSDFQAAKGFDAVVASYLDDFIEGNRRYKISRHLL